MAEDGWEMDWAMGLVRQVCGEKLGEEFPNKMGIAKSREEWNCPIPVFGSRAYSVVSFGESSLLSLAITRVELWRPAYKVLAF